MARGKPHSEETRAQVIASLLAGKGVNEVAAEFDLDKSIVSRWRSQMPAEQLQLVATQKHEDFGAMVALFLQETLTTLTEQARHFRDKNWLNQQSASELGVLHGIQADKAFQLFAAAERAANAIGTAAGSDETANLERLAP